MARGEVCFIGDEVTAAGFRMAGLRIVVPEPGGAARAFRDAQADAAMIYLSPEVADEIPFADLTAALRGADPLVLVVPDIAGRKTPPDLPKRILSLLGLDS
ncbi:hypothetical protein RGUI_2845 [Rhodovulum sp. P5]|uniref:V-type ATP synthase subunit F n=1 Tax=Rhodovulum sp. P5 TaxID=1564506 RepID=UPI0009C22FA7|nr:V-type ATP synthase subunit F [Rhodovulum sp. P5]ARE40986.1 hypothetical protein RGUI_2845 [Rhodovulum sp. P5]